MAISEPRKYWAFLSYSHRDQRWARWLHRALETYRLPDNLKSSIAKPLPKQLAPVFRDRDELPSSHSLTEAVHTALEQSESLIVICSPEAARSRWVNEEIRVFQALGRSNRIFCLIVAGEPYSGDERECLPEALTKPDESGGPRPEPAAADARRQGDGRRNASIKLIAGILGVDYDALKNRDQRRRHRRMTAIAAGSLAVAAVTVTLAISATIARREADVRRSQAEDLIDYMLGDLYEHMREIGRLDVYESVGEKALEYFTALRDEDVSPRVLAQRSRNLRQIGEVRMDRGNLESALEAYEESLRIISRLAEQKPNDAETQLAYANGLFYVGYIHWQQGNMPAATRHFEAVLPIVDELSARNPESTDYLLEKGFAYTNLGRVLELTGANESAREAYETVMRVNQQLVGIDPENPQFQIELGFAHNNIGKLVVTLGKLDEAGIHFREDLAIKERILKIDPNHNMRRSYVAVSQYFLGQLLGATGNGSEARALLLESLRTMEVLTDLNPDRKEWIARRANILRELARLSAWSRDYGQSHEYLETSIESLAGLVELEGLNVPWRRDLARSLLLAADLESKAGHHELAAGYLQSASIHLDSLIQLEPSITRDTRKLMIRADLCEARIEKLADSEAARRASINALDSIDTHFADTSDPQLLEMKFHALQILDRAGEANRIRQQLRSIGFDAKVLEG